MSEKVLGKCLKAVGMPRNEYIVSTKCGRYAEGFDFSAERVTRSIDESLARLQLDYVDILQCHDIEFGSLDQVLSGMFLIFLLNLYLFFCFVLCCFSFFFLVTSEYQSLTTDSLVLLWESTYSSSCTDYSVSNKNTSCQHEQKHQ